jgi:cysteine desulfurase
VPKKKKVFILLSISLPSMNPLIGLQLDMKGIAVSQGSACSSGAAKPSSVCQKYFLKRYNKLLHHLEFLFSHQTTNKI